VKNGATRVGELQFHPWKSNLKLIITLLEQHYNNPNHIMQPSSQVGPIFVVVAHLSIRDAQNTMGTRETRE
jgi:hypothetical protein